VSRFNPPLSFKRSWISRYGFAVLSITATLIISLWLTPLVDIGLASRSGRALAFPGTLFFCAVMLSAWYGGIGPGLLATTFSSLAFDYYLRHSPQHPNPDEIPRLVMFVVANLLVGSLSAAQRSAKESLKSARDDLQGTVQDLEKTNEALHAESIERKQTEGALRQALADIARVNRVSSMGELTASLAHEVNQPISAAITNANTCLRWLARDQLDLDEARAAASRSINDATRAAEIIKRVRLLFKKEEPQRELVDLNDAIQEMTLLLHSEAIQFAVLVRTELAANLPPVMGDRVQLQQVLMNLVMNSIDAMKDVEGARELTIESQRSENAQVQISISDTGVGLPPQHADKIFDAFFTTKTDGTGMGLQISRSIVESHGGRLWAAGNPPHGARFYFALPIRGETRVSVASEDRTEPADGPSGQQLHR
jgi:C4-dicarboxylate-specific signal transduction histidine kinase